MPLTARDIERLDNEVDLLNRSDVEEQVLREGDMEARRALGDILQREGFVWVVDAEGGKCDPRETAEGIAELLARIERLVPGLDGLDELRAARCELLAGASVGEERCRWLEQAVAFREAELARSASDGWRHLRRAGSLVRRAEAEDDPLRAAQLFSEACQGFLASLDAEQPARPFDEWLSCLARMERHPQAAVRAAAASARLDYRAREEACAEPEALTAWMEALMRQAERLRNQGEGSLAETLDAQAERLAERAFAHEGPHLRELGLALVRLARTSARLPLAERALACFWRSSLANPTDGYLHLYAAEAQKLMAELAGSERFLLDAAETCRKAVHEGAGTYEVCCELARLELRLGALAHDAAEFRARLVGSIRAAHLALLIHPTYHAEPHKALVVAHARLGEHDKSRGYLRGLLERWWRFWRDEADLEQQVPTLMTEPETRSLVSRFLERNPQVYAQEELRCTEAALAVHEGRGLLRIGDRAAAAARFRKAVELYAANAHDLHQLLEAAEAWMQLAEATETREREGAFEGAAQVLERARGLANELWPQPDCALAEVCRRRGDSAGEAQCLARLRARFGERLDLGAVGRIGCWWS